MFQTTSEVKGHRMEFTPFQIADNDLHEKVRRWCNGNLSGCYQVYSVDEDGNRARISRLIGNDANGIIYIGASRRLPGRMADLKKSVSAAYKTDGYKSVWSHMVGRKASKPFLDLFAFESLHVEVRRCLLSDEGLTEIGLDGKRHFKEEAALLKSYVDRFGEAPPLNG